MNEPVLEFDPALPISEWVPEIVSTLAEHQVVVIAGETGSGKTTQIPKMCLLAGRRKIAHTQPRRLAARTLAERIAEEMRVELGTAVGYQVRFTRKATRDTAVTVMTDGVLLNAISHDRMLRAYDTIIIDEAHERSLNIDFLLGYLKQLLPKRPDLKVIVTSATIDTERFAQHFDAPVIEVSGRTFPVDIRYRPLEVEEGVRDQNAAIADAVKELTQEGDGDILVFFSGEREIRDAADYLQGLNLPRTEVLALYARLSAADQHKVFQPHTGRRIVLATNVAETSLTVPGIRYVVDVGTARISRYSARTKVQRLPIEPISKASANQRSGRCGRVAPGIAIRLYAEEDFEARPDFTEPEILRTNLASVILQMADVRLGRIDDFPFVEPPDRAQINDGLRLLEELGALEGMADGLPQLTGIGRQLAKIPVDPRLGRMLIEADRQSCLREVLAIVAGLSIQDPRERPPGQEEAADASHRRFHSDGVLTGEVTEPTDDGDFQALWRLWRYLGQLQADLSGNAFRRRCREEFLHFVRIREWQDLHGQLTDVAKDLGLRFNDQPAGLSSVHAALLSGLLSHIGLADVPTDRKASRGRVRLGPREYTGARGSRFVLSRGSSIAKRPPELVMAYELVETNRLWAHTVAPIDAAIVEQVGEHLLKRTYSEPHWSSKRGAAMAYERITLLGVPIAADRLVGYSKINPVEARELFIRKALVEGDWRTRHHFYARNAATLEQAEEMEQRTRRRNIVSDDSIYDFYDKKIPAEVVSQTHFDRWWKDQRRRCDDFLDLRLEDLSDAVDDFAFEEFPDAWVVGEHSLDVDYVFDPGASSDGVRIEIPLSVLNQLAAKDFSWHVPGRRHELATELIRSLPKPLRTKFVPAPDVARKALDWLGQHPEVQRDNFSHALGTALTQLTGVPVPAEAWSPEKLPSHLRISYVVSDGDKELATGEDLEALQGQLRQKVTASLTKAADGLASSGHQKWDFGEVPREVNLTSSGESLKGYPALTDELTSVGVHVYDSRERQEHHHRRGLRRLLALTNPDPTRSVIIHLSMADKLALGTGPYPSVPGLLADARLAALDDALGSAVEAAEIIDADRFARLREKVRPGHADHMQKVVAAAAETLRRHDAALRAAAALPSGSTRKDVREQLANLIFDGFLAATPGRWRPHLPRYLAAAIKRCEAALTNPAKDERGAQVMAEVEDDYAALCAALPPGPLPAAIDDIGWAIEELRVSVFAQTLGTSMPVSAKRVRTMMEKAQ